MESIYIALVAITAGIGAAVAIAATLLHKRKPKTPQKKAEDLVQRFIELKAKKYSKTKKELDHLDSLFKAGELDEETYERLKSVLLKGEFEKEEEADVFKYALNKNKQ